MPSATFPVACARARSEPWMPWGLARGRGGASPLARGLGVIGPLHSCSSRPWSGEGSTARSGVVDGLKLYLGGGSGRGVCLPSYQETGDGYNVQEDQLRWTPPGQCHQFLPSHRAALQIRAVCVCDGRQIG